MDLFWERDEWEKNDPHLMRIKNISFERKVPFIPKEKGLYIIRGPRQIGKSTWLKKVLSYYSQKEKCFYLSCENVDDNKELAAILESVRGRKIILLDEVNFVNKWDRAIKHEIDLGRHHVVMLTGSHAYDLKKGADTMPGRFGEGGEFFLLPMLFDEFNEVRTMAGWAKSNRVEELEDYFRIGGFPDAVAEVGSSNAFPKKTMKTYWKWLQGDTIKLGKQEKLLEGIIVQIAITLQNPVSYQTLKKQVNSVSHNTVIDYIGFLESCFAVRQLNAIDLNTGAWHLKKNKKFYFTDPLLFHLGCHLGGIKRKETDNEKLAEMIAHEYLARKYRRFGYASGSKGEIDFILPKKWAREVKWTTIPTNFSRLYLNLALPDKKVWTKDNFLKNG